MLRYYKEMPDKPLNQNNEFKKLFIMNENLNLLEKLKNVPAGTRFFSTIYGDVVFAGINHYNLDCPIRYKPLCDIGENFTYGLNSRGTYLDGYPDAECTLFPSKDQRDWSEFEYNPIVIGTPCMVCQSFIGGWNLRYYAGDGQCYDEQKMEGKAVDWDIIIPVYEFDFENLCRKGKQ